MTGPGGSPTPPWGPPPPGKSACRGLNEPEVEQSAGLLSGVASARPGCTRVLAQMGAGAGPERGPSGRSGCRSTGRCGRTGRGAEVGGGGGNTGGARGLPVALASAGRRGPPDRRKSGDNKDMTSSESHYRSPAGCCAPNELEPRASSRMGCRRTTVQGREGCKQGPLQGRPRALWTFSAWCPRAPTESPLCRPSSPSLFLFHSDQISP